MSDSATPSGSEEQKKYTAAEVREMAVQRIGRILADPSSPAKLVIQAANVLLEMERQNMRDQGIEVPEPPRSPAGANGNGPAI
jgi:hypothetical protein